VKESVTFCVADIKTVNVLNMEDLFFSSQHRIKVKVSSCGVTDLFNVCRHNPLLLDINNFPAQDYRPCDCGNLHLRVHEQLK
jgi:hypothetical protein